MLKNEDKIRRSFRYNPDTGDLVRVFKNGKVRLIDQLDYKGYVIVSVNGRPFKAHRLIFFLCTGHIPEIVDHVNGVKNDNRWSNLRPCSKSQNSMNRGKQNNNSTGFKNIRKSPSGKFTVRVSGKWIGTFITIEEALIEAEKAREELHREFART